MRCLVVLMVIVLSTAGLASSGDSSTVAKTFHQVQPRRNLVVFKIPESPAASIGMAGACFIGVGWTVHTFASHFLPHSEYPTARGIASDVGDGLCLGGLVSFGAGLTCLGVELLQQAARRLAAQCRYENLNDGDLEIP